MMADDDATFAGLAVDLNAESKAKRRKPKLPAEFDSNVTHTGPEPQLPARGESWQASPGGPIKYWHGQAWYLSPIDGAAIIAASAPEPEPAPTPTPAPESGDGGGAGRQHLTAIERMESAASEFVMNHRSLVDDARDFMVEQIKMRPKPWSATSEGEQRDVYAAAEHGATELVRKIVEALAVEDKQPIRALLESYVEKDGIKLSLKVKTFNDDEAEAAVVQLHRARGKHVLLTVASVDDYKQGRRPGTEPDQPPLDFEAGTDHPDDDSDLAGNDGEEERSDAGEFEEASEAELAQQEGRAAPAPGTGAAAIAAMNAAETGTAAAEDDDYDFGEDSADD